MTITVPPIFQSSVTDNPTDTTAGKVTPSRWNQGSKIQMATARLIGRTTAGAGDAEEISVGNGLALASGSLAADIATVANLRAALANKVVTADLIESASAIVSLADATTIAIDWDAFIVADLTVTANRTFGNPTNVQVGTTRYIIVKGSSATARTLSFSSNFKGTLPTDTVTSTAYLLIGMTAYSATHIIVSSCKAL